jgi:AcrR family transcriptional regulator
MAKTTRRTTAKGDALRNAILDAAARLFIERGLGGTSMQDIAEALGVTRTAVYYYFKNKEQILVTFSERILLAAKDFAAQLATRTDLDPVEALQRLVEHHTRLILSHPLEFRVGDRHELYLPPKHRAAVQAARRSVLENFTRMIERGIRTGHLRMVDARIAAFSLIGMCNWAAWWYQPGGRLSAKEIAAVVADLAVHSLKREASRKLKDANVHDSLRALREDVSFLERVLAERA